MTNPTLNELAEQVVLRAREKNLTLATAESCTGGWIGKALTDVPGSSRVFLGGLIAYSNAIKENLLGVQTETLINDGAVSEPTALAMANNCAQCFEVDIAVSVTGIAGPGGGTKDKPVGLAYMGIHANGIAKTHQFNFEDLGRDSVRQQAVISALKLILSAIEKQDLLIAKNPRD